MTIGHGHGHNQLKGDFFMLADIVVLLKRKWHRMLYKLGKIWTIFFSQEFGDSARARKLYIDDESEEEEELEPNPKLGAGDGDGDDDDGGDDDDDDDDYGGDDDDDDDDAYLPLLGTLLAL